MLFSDQLLSPSYNMARRKHGLRLSCIYSLTDANTMQLEEVPLPLRLPRPSQLQALLQMVRAGRLLQLLQQAGYFS